MIQDDASTIERLQSGPFLYKLDPDQFVPRVKKRALAKLGIGQPSMDSTNPAMNQPLLADRALAVVLKHLEFDSVLDVGSGAGRHADLFESAGKNVTAIDFGRSVYYQRQSERRLAIIADYYDHCFEEPFDLVWASHVLEHQPNPNLFLQKIHRDTKESGYVCITVPPMKHDIVGGHLSLWNAGLLLYHLVFAGFNCRSAMVHRYGYNISVIVQKQSISLPELHFDSGDVDRIAEFLPSGLREGFNGNLRSLNWPE